jgi:glycolate oxidase FAD binding subunit
LPCPAAESSCRFTMGQQESVLAVNQWLGQALPISASCWLDGELTLRFSGARAAVQAALRLTHQRSGGVCLDQDEASVFWQALREQQLPFFAGAGSRRRLWRVALPALAPALDFAGSQLIEWGGAQRWLLEDAGIGTPGAAPDAQDEQDAQDNSQAGSAPGSQSQFANDLRAQAQARGGHATLFRAADKRLPVFQAVAPALAAIQSKVQACFDPARIFNPARIEFGG